MQLEDYFDMQGPEDIRIRGHRIGIETVLYEHIHRGRTPEQIAAQFPTLSLEEVYACTGYLGHPALESLVARCAAVLADHACRPRSL